MVSEDNGTPERHLHSGLCLWLAPLPNDSYRCRENSICLFVKPPGSLTIRISQALCPQRWQRRREPLLPLLIYWEHSFVGILASFCCSDLFTGRRPLSRHPDCEVVKVRRPGHQPSPRSSCLAQVSNTRCRISEGFSFAPLCPVNYTQ